MPHSMTCSTKILTFRGGSRAAATSKMERFVIIVNGCKPLTIITKRSILDVAVVLDPPLTLVIAPFLFISWRPLLIYHGARCVHFTVPSEKKKCILLPGGTDVHIQQHIH